MKALISLYLLKTDTVKLKYFEIHQHFQVPI